MRLFRKKDKSRDPALAQAQAQVRVSLAAAEHRRDTERRKLAEERSAVVLPLREAHQENHLSELAMQALGRRRSS
jgi:hypothetical protein